MKPKGHIAHEDSDSDTDDDESFFKVYYLYI